MTHERRQVLVPAVLLFGILAGHALLETARDAMFLARLPPQHLAWAYMAIAVAALTVMATLRRWSIARDPRRLLAITLAIAAAGTGVLAATVSGDSSLVFVLYVWTGLVATLVVPNFWTMVDRSNRVVEAKRRFARISAGGVLGALVGSAVAGALGHVLPTHSLVVVAAVVFGLVAVTSALVAPAPLPDEAPLRSREGQPTVAMRSPRYLRILLVLGVCSTVTVTLVDLTFKRAFAEAFDAPHLATAFGLLYTTLNLVALVIQLVVTSRLLERIGVTAALTILPALVTLTAVGFVATGAFLSLLLLKLSDGGLRHSLHRVASEILYLPLPSAVRDRWKPIVDAVGQRGGQVLAAFAWFTVTTQDVSTTAIAGMLAVLGTLWLVALHVTRRSYVAQFRSMVAAGEIERNVRITALDADSTKLLDEAISSPDELEALAALEVLGHAGNVPAFVLYHPRVGVVRRALELLSGDQRTEVTRILEHLVDHADPTIRAAALTASGRTGSGHDRLRIALEDRHADVRAAAVVWLINDPELGDIAHEQLEALLHGSLDEKLALARALESRPLEKFRDIIDELLASPEARLRRATLRVLRCSPELARTDRLLQLLEDPHCRGDARRVFVALGTRGLDVLIAALDDARTPLGVRRHLPRTISRFVRPVAVAALAGRLAREPDGTTEFKILRALGRMRSDAPHLPVDPKLVEAYLHRSVEDAARYTTLLDRIGDDTQPSLELVRELLREKQRWSIEHAFRALGILYPRSGVRTLYGAVRGKNKERRAAAHELLEPMLPMEIRLPLFAILDDLPPDVRRKRLAATQFGHRALDSEEDLLVALLTDPSESLRCLAAYHIAERHLSGLRHHLDRLRPDVGPPLVLYAFDQAIARLDA